MAVLVGVAMLASIHMVEPGDQDQIAALAARVGVDETDLRGVHNTMPTVDLTDYLRSEGWLPPTPAPKPALSAALERRLDCVAQFESHNTPSARNPRSGAAGPYQFLLSTWASTPQGRAGLSPYDPVASREAARWMFNQGRAHEWVAVTSGGC